VSSEDAKSNQVRSQSKAADNQDELRVSNFGRVNESGERFENDGHAKGDQEDGVEEGAEDFSAKPLQRLSVSAPIVEIARNGASRDRLTP
jgi:hypothetical protein